MLDRLKNESERSFWQRMHLYYTMKAEEEVSHFPSGAQVYATLAAAAATRALSERVVNS